MINLELIGNLGKDAVVRDVNGQKAISFSIAHTEKFTNAQGEKMEKTLWVNCTKWVGSNQSTNIAKYLKKGSKVCVTGVPNVSTYTNNDGKAVSDFKCSVSRIELLVVPKDEVAELTGDINPNISEDAPY